jgi:homoserine dehydrogenase
MQQVNLGMIGGGTVGSGVFHAWQKNGGLMAARLGVKLVFRKIAVKAFDEPRPYPITRSLMTTDWREVVNDPQIQVVIELVGGCGIAKTMILAALEKGKTVVTANKALLSAHGPELFAAAAKSGANLYYEASVCGGIPIIKSLREGFVANQFPAIYGIVNGTCNYILTRMKQEGAEFADVLADAQKQGYAETPPDLDIDGHDAQHKIGILASLAHGFWVNHRAIHTEGIREVSKIDMEFAAKLGYTIKLLGIVKQISDLRSTIDESNGKSARKSKIVNRKSGVQVSVYPTLIPNSHVLASVNHVFNAVFVRGVPHAKNGRVVPMDEIISRYYVRFSVVDRPGVLAKISAVFAAAKIGISSVIQPEGHEGESVPLILMIHDAPNAAMRRALAKISKLSVVKAKPVMIRVESFE